MKAVKSKAQERREIEHQISLFLQRGGKVETVAPGTSGRDISNDYKRPPISFQGAPREARTPLLEEIRAIEARRGRPPTPKSPKRKSPRRVLITDDFGEPLRWSWRDN